VQKNVASTGTLSLPNLAEREIDLYLQVGRAEEKKSRAVSPEGEGGGVWYELPAATTILFCSAPKKGWMGLTLPVEKKKAG